MMIRTTGLVLASTVAALALSGCERPPVDTEQTGFRGTAIVKVTNPRLVPEVSVPEPLPPVPQVGPKAGDIYQNVQVLGDLSVTEFNRTMQAATQWVAPEQGCNYCHNPENLASDEKYTKVVARRMHQMTRDINGNWTPHVGETGVTCYTCHRGQNVPEYIWFADDSEPYGSDFAGWRAGQNMANGELGTTSLPTGAFDLLTQQDSQIRVQNNDSPFPVEGTPGIKQTEYTFGLMIHMSGALGVNCTYCHNSNNFATWTTSSPMRVNAWHGLNMVKSLNENYLIPLGPVYPENRLGPGGDAPKAYCTTCHGGLPKPLGGAQMALDYPGVWPDGPPSVESN
jgi:photosynthetic reaction center cytochrome c subunit